MRLFYATIAKGHPCILPMILSSFSVFFLQAFYKVIPAFPYDFSFIFGLFFMQPF